MTRDSLFGESVIWSGGPTEVRTPTGLRVTAGLLLLVAVVSLLFAVTQVYALAASPAPSLLYAAWCTALGVLCLVLPKWWLSQVKYVVTQNHVIWQRGPFRRSIERRSISFARIFWSRHHPGVGSLQLVRAVPTGALRRRLTMQLPGLLAPDRVWAIIRGAEDVAPIGRSSRPLTQRLDHGERVLWAARPASSWRVYLPQGRREWLLAIIALGLVGVIARLVTTGLPILYGLVEAGLAATSLAFWALALGMSLAGAVIAGTAAYILYDGVVRRASAHGDTHYLITNRRVLIQRGREELHLSRSRVVDVIDTPAAPGQTNVFLVLDGPRARALAASGAFGELTRSPRLRPVFEHIADAEGALRILRQRLDPPLPRAA